MFKKPLCVVLAVNVFTLSFPQTITFSSPMEELAYYNAKFVITIDKDKNTINEKYLLRESQLIKVDATPEEIEEYKKYYYLYSADFAEQMSKKTWKGLYESISKKHIIYATIIISLCYVAWLIYDFEKNGWVRLPDDMFEDLN